MNGKVADYIVKTAEEFCAAHLELAAIDALSTCSITAREVTALDHEIGLHTGGTILPPQHTFCRTVLTLTVSNSLFCAW